MTSLLCARCLAPLLAVTLVFGCESSAPDDPSGPAGTPPGSAPAAAASASPSTQARRTPPVQPQGHHRMVKMLADIAARAPEENRYQGDRLARDLRAQIDDLDESSPLRDRWRLHRLAGVAELRAGNEREGIELLSTAYALLPRVSGEIGGFYAAETAFQLAVGHLRIGETENCCARFTPESCVLPIRGGGIHSKPEGSTQAAFYFAQVARMLPRDHDLHLASRWLSNIAYMTIDGYPDRVPPELLIPESAFRSSVPFPRFENIANKLGVDRFNGSGGVIVDDFDNDGRLDLLSSTWEPAGELRLFIGVEGGKLEDRTPNSGLEGITGGLNLVQSDYDNDGDLDFLSLRGAWLGPSGRHPNSLVRNNGDGTFTDVTFDAGLGDTHFPTQTAAWADFDADGDLDLYVGNETTTGLAAPCQLFENLGNGTFRDIAAPAGVTNDRFTKGVAWGDYDNDGDPDLYVSNLGAENRLYRNDGGARFVDVGPELGVTGPLKSFPVWFWDFDNDGNLDIFASAYDGDASAVARFHLRQPSRHERACLYRGDGKGGFTEVAARSGLGVPMLPMGANFGDIDGDGFLDFYLGTGNPSYESLVPNLMFLNQGGNRFVDISMAGGFAHLQKGHAIAFADLDHDGDVDVFEQMGGAYLGDRFRDALFENPGFGNRWIALRLVGSKSNRSAIGARIEVEVELAGETRSIHRSVTSGGSFGANPLRQTIGLGKSNRIRSLRIDWPTTGRTQRFTDVPLDSDLVVTEGEDRLNTR